MTDTIKLNSLRMNHFTVSDAELYCKIFNINPDNIKVLFLYNNNLTDISGVSIFKNLKHLKLSNNTVKDLSFLINLINLEYLYINNLNLTDEIETLNILKSLPNLKDLYCFNTFKKIKIRNELKSIEIYD